MEHRRDRLRELILQGRYEDALKYCDEVLRGDPHNSIFVSEKAQLMAMPFPGLDNPGGALQLLETEIAKGVETPDLYLALGFVHEYGASDHPAAAAAYKNAMRVDPDNAQAYFSLGCLYQTPGVIMEAQEALAYLTKASALAPSDWQIHRELAKIYWSIRDNSGAEKEYRAALSCDPGPDPDSSKQIKEWLARVSAGESFEKGYLRAV